MAKSAKKSAKSEIPQSEAGLEIGVASVDITPPVGATMVGYKPRTSDGVGHRLRAEALVCKGPGGAWALLTSDTIGFRRGYVERVRRRIEKATGLKPEAVMITGTHTHSGPATTQFGGESLGKSDAAYLEELEERLAGVVSRAMDAVAPGAFEVAWTEAPALGSNRRIKSDTGQWVNEWQDDDGKHPGYFDPTVMLVGVRRPGALGPEALVVNFGCHPVALGPSSLKISADYCGYLKDTVEAWGDAGTVLFAQAGGANINPRTCIRVGAEFPRRMGEALAEIVSDATMKLSPVAGTRVASSRVAWKIKRTRDAMKGADQKNTRSGDTFETEIQVLRAGDLVLVSTPGELFSEFNRLLREASPLPHTVVLSLANDYIGYLPTDVAQAEGAYETNMAPAKGIEGMIMEHARKGFAAIAD